MPSQTISLGPATFAGDPNWQGSILISPDFISGHGTAYLRSIERLGPSIRIRLSATADGEPTDAGPEFTPELEQAAQALTFQGNSSLTLKGPGHPDNTFSDPTEPYFWTPDNGQAFVSWMSAQNQAEVFLTLDDGIVYNDAWGQVRAGVPRITGRAERIISLADADTDNYTYELLALIRASDPPEIYSRDPRPVAGTLLDGEFNLSASDEPVNALRFRNQGSGAGGQRISLHDNGPLHLLNYFSDGGQGNDLILQVMTGGGSIAFPVESNIAAGGSNYIIFNVPAPDQSFVAGITEGHEFIFALARSVIYNEARGTIRAGTPTIRGQAEELTYNEARGTIRAGTPSIRGMAEELPTAEVYGTIRAGTPTIRGQAEELPTAEVYGTIRAGTPSIRGQAEELPTAEVYGTIRAGAPTIRGMAVPAGARIEIEHGDFTTLDILFEGGATAKYSDSEHPDYPAYAPRISSAPRIQQALPDPIVPSLPPRTADIRLNNIAGLDGDTISEHLAAGRELLGASATVRVREGESGSDRITLHGYVSEILSIGPRAATIQVSDDLLGDQSQLVPKRRLKDIYPSAIGAADKQAIACVLGKARKIPLARVSSGDVWEISVIPPANPPGAVNNARVWLDVEGWSNYTVVSGDTLEYEVTVGQNITGARLDLRTVGGSIMSGTTDQNGVSATGGTDLTGRARGKFYRRSIDLPASAVGQQISSVRIRIDFDNPAGGKAQLGRAAIVGANGSLRRSLTSPTLPALSLNSASPNGYDFSVESGQRAKYGAIRKPASGALTISAVYLNARVAAVAEYAVEEDILGIQTVRFLVDPGSQAVVQVDAVSTEFSESPARALEWALADSTDGLGLSVASGPISSAVGHYTDLGIIIGGAIVYQEPAGDLVPKLLLHGARLSRRANLELDLKVDTLASHRIATIGLGQNDRFGWDNFTAAEAAPARQADRARTLKLFAAPDPGFSGEALTWLAETERSRNMPAGRPLEKFLPYSPGLATTDRLAHYLWERAQTLDKRLSGSIILASEDDVNIQLGDRIRATIPALGLDQQEYEIAALETQGAAVQLDMVQWRASAYAYQAGDSQIPPAVQSYAPDYSRTLPQAPSNLVVTADAPVDLSGDEQEITLSVSATAPSVNVTALIFRAIRTGGAATRAQIELSVTPGGSASGKLIVDAGTEYTVEAWAQNSGNDPGYQDGTVVSATVTSQGIGISAPEVSRGPGHYNREISGTSWSNSEANAATPGDNVERDRVLLFNLSGNNNYTEVRKWDGSNWVPTTDPVVKGPEIPVDDIPGDRIRELSADKLTAGSIEVGTANHPLGIKIKEGAELELWAGRQGSYAPSSIVFKSWQGALGASLTYYQNRFFDGIRLEPSVDDESIFYYRKQQQKMDYYSGLR